MKRSFLLLCIACSTPLIADDMAHSFFVNASVGASVFRLKSIDNMYDDRDDNLEVGEFSKKRKAGFQGGLSGGYLNVYQGFLSGIEIGGRISTARLKTLYNFLGNTYEIKSRIPGMVYAAFILGADTFMGRFYGKGGFGCSVLKRDTDLMGTPVKETEYMPTYVFGAGYSRFITDSFSIGFEYCAEIAKKSRTVLTRLQNPALHEKTYISKTGEDKSFTQNFSVCFTQHFGVK